MAIRRRVCASYRREKTGEKLDSMCTEREREREREREGGRENNKFKEAANSIATL